jgi:hypothetical protein
VSLESEIVEVEAEIDGLAAGTTDRAALEERVSKLCAAVVARPAAEAKTLLPDMERLIAALDRTAAAIQARNSDSPAAGRPARAAAAAYGASQTRARRGF